MADFFYWNKPSTDEGFGLLSVYLKNPVNGRPGWYFANPSAYWSTGQDRSGTLYRKMPLKFGIHHLSAELDEAHKPTKIGNPGDYLVERGPGGGGLQIINEHEYGLVFAENSMDLPGQKVAESSITIQTGATGTVPGSPPATMGGSYSGGY